MDIGTIYESPLMVITSMATRHVLSELASLYHKDTGHQVEIESVGGVEAARRVTDGEAVDVVVLASDAIDRLHQAGRVEAGSRVDIARSTVAVAVRVGATNPCIGTEAELRDAVLASAAIGYSTGPSGVYLEMLFARWGIANAIASRIVQAPPGVPVATLISNGKVELGFQQLSELLNQPGITIVGPLPDEVQLITVFSGAACSASTRVDAGSQFLRFLLSAATTTAKVASGMAPA